MKRCILCVRVLQVLQKAQKELIHFGTSGISVLGQ